MRILLVEDDGLLGDGIRAGLKQEGFAVDWTQDGQAAKLALETEAYAVVVLDLGLPKLGGMELLKWLRANSAPMPASQGALLNQVPVLILTARDTVADRVAGLNAGADDYLIKPFDLDELIARVRALLRRHSGQVLPKLTHGTITLDPAAHVVQNAGALVELSSKEFALLHALLNNVGRVQSREQLEQQLYGWGDEVESNSVEVHIHHLRKKLGSTFIRTMRGVGYVIDKER